MPSRAGLDKLCRELLRSWLDHLLFKTSISQIQYRDYEDEFVCKRNLFTLIFSITSGKELMRLSYGFDIVM